MENTSSFLLGPLAIAFPFGTSSYCVCGQGQLDLFVTTPKKNTCNGEIANKEVKSVLTGHTIFL